MNGLNKYEDIMNLPHHVSTSHPRMAIYDRAAQFSPFAALTGHDEAIKETSRLTNQRIELEESSKQLLDARLQILINHLNSHPEIEVTYFIPDEKKEGGCYTTQNGRVTKIDTARYLLYLEENQFIPIKEIISLNGDLFQSVEE